MTSEMRAGFVNGDVTYEKWFCGTKVYKQKLNENFEFHLWNSSGRNWLVRVVGKNFFLCSNGTVGKAPTRRLFKWELRLNPLGAPKKEWHTVCRDAKGELSFYDGDFFEAQNKAEMERANAKKAEEMKEVDRIVELSIERCNAVYHLIQNKELFLEQLKEYIHLYRFDAREDVEEILGICVECFDLFLQGERELPTFIQSLNYDKVLQEYSAITQLGATEEELREIVNRAVADMKNAENFGPWITEYKEEIYQYLEDEVEGYVYEKNRLKMAEYGEKDISLNEDVNGTAYKQLLAEKEKIKAEFLRKYSVEKLVEIYSSKLNGLNSVEEAKKCVEVALNRVFAEWKIITDESFLFEKIGKEVENFLISMEGERRRQELIDFYDMWGEEKIIDLTPEKCVLFSEVESGKCTDNMIIKEYELYQKLLSEYEELVYKKNQRGLKPTFVAIPDYCDFCLKIFELAQKHYLINEEGVFVNWEGFEEFVRDVKKYEKVLAKK